MNKYFFALLFLLSITTWQCGNNGYSLRGISIPADVSTYYVGQFKNNALNAPPTLAIETAEALKEKIRRESRLILNETEPDVEFQGTIVDFRVTAEAPQPGESSAINRLTIITAVEYISNKNEEDGFKQNFSFFFDFPATTDLSAVQTQAIEDILAQITEDIFNKAFTNW
ncbi:MAG: LPS assembly lipoprotein LptE [Bacteroidota bacterium]